VSDEAGAHWTFKIPTESQRNKSDYSCKQARIKKARLEVRAGWGRGFE